MMRSAYAYNVQCQKKGHTEKDYLNLFNINYSIRISSPHLIATQFFKYRVTIFLHNNMKRVGNVFIRLMFCLNFIPMYAFLYKIFILLSKLMDRKLYYRKRF